MSPIVAHVIIILFDVRHVTVCPCFVEEIKVNKWNSRRFLGIIYLYFEVLKRGAGCYGFI